MEPGGVVVMLMDPGNMVDDVGLHRGLVDDRLDDLLDMVMDMFPAVDGDMLVGLGRLGLDRLVLVLGLLLAETSRYLRVLAMLEPLGLDGK